MKRSSFARVAILMALSAMVVFAADITGDWLGEMGGPNGEGFQISFAFKQANTKLTGSATGPQGDPLAISDGKVDGDKVYFNVVFNGMTIKHEGAISGDEIKLNVSADQAEFPGGTMALKRSR